MDYGSLQTSTSQIHLPVTSVWRKKFWSIRYSMTVWF